MNALIMEFVEIILAIVSLSLLEKHAKYLMLKIIARVHPGMKLYFIYMEQYQ